MRAHDVEICLLFNEPNVRYATGVTAMPVYAMSTFVRCAVVPQEGTPILFEHANSMHRSALRAPDVRPRTSAEQLVVVGSMRQADADQLGADGACQGLYAHVGKASGVGYPAHCR